MGAKHKFIMKNVKIEKNGTTTVKGFTKFVDVKVDGKALKMVKGGESKVIVNDDMVIG